MRVVVYYQSGLVDVFDTLNFTNNEPYRDTSCAIVTEFALRLDLIEREGLVMDTFVYDKDADDDAPRAKVEEVTVPFALRRPGHRVRLVARGELRRVAKVTLDGELMLWRQGDELINAVKFANQEVLCFSNATTTSINQKAMSIFSYLQKANPELDADKVAGLMGFTQKAIEDIRYYEQENGQADDSEFDED